MTHFRIDLLPPLKGWDSPKGSARLRVSSARKYAFAWGVRRWPLGYDPERAFQRVQPGQRGLPTRTRRAFRRPEYQFGPPRSGIQPTGYHHSRPTRWPERGGMVLRLSYPAGCGREASVGVEGPVPRPGNAVTTQYERSRLNRLGNNSRPATDPVVCFSPCRLHPTAEAVGFRLEQL
jgi:hypothetical protein